MKYCGISWLKLKSATSGSANKFTVRECVHSIGNARDAQANRQTKWHQVSRLEQRVSPRCHHSIIQTGEFSISHAAGDYSSLFLATSRQLAVIVDDVKCRGVASD